jgi:hypothetical protein
MDLSTLSDAGVVVAASAPVAAHFDLIAWLTLPATSLPGQPAHWLVLLTALYVALEAGLKRAKIPPNSPLEALANLLAMVPGVGRMAAPWTTPAAPPAPQAPPPANVAP